MSLSIQGRLVASAAIAFAALAGTSAYNLLEDRANALDWTTRQVHFHARSLAEHGARTLSGINLTLDHFVKETARARYGDTLPGPLEQMMRAHLDVLPQIRELLITNRDGTVVRASLDDAIGLDVSDRAYFRNLRGNPHQDLYVGEPTRGRVTGNWFLSMAQPIRTTEGAFDGIVLAVVNTEFMGLAYEALEAEEGVRSALVNRAGSIVATSPGFLAGTVSEAGRRLNASPLFLGLATTRRPLSREGRLVAGGDIQLVGAAPLEGAPLVVLSTVGRDAALAPWKAHATEIALTNLGMGLLILALTIAGIRLMRKREAATAAMEESEERHRLLFETAGDAIFIADAETGFIVEANPQAGVLLGRPVEEIVGLHQSALHPPEDTDHYRRVFAEHVASGSASDVQAEVIHADGTHLPVEISARLFLHGEHKFIQARFRDVSERVEAEAALRREKENAERFLAISEAVIVGLDREGRVRLINPRGCDLLGYKGHELIGRDWFDTVLPGTESAATRRAFIALVGGLDEPVEYHENDILTRSGDRRRLQWHNAVIRDGSLGQVVTLSSGIDVTELRRAEAFAVEAKTRAEIANRTKSEFLANMSHELRTPLNAIIGFSDTIQHEVFGPLGNAKYVEYMSNIHESGQHLLELINDILDVSAIEAGKLELAEAEVSLPDIAKSCIGLVRGRAEQGRVRLVSEVPDDLPPVSGDRRRLKQVVLNLLSNAVKFTPENGNVRLEAGLDEQGAVFLQVRDSGVGMSAEEIRTALTPFGQVSTGLQRRHEGTGLGLPLTRALVELHDGEMTLESRPGQGTVVTVRLPSERVLAAA